MCSQLTVGQACAASIQGVLQPQCECQATRFAYTGMFGNMLFGNKYIGTAVERYVKDIVHQHARTWAYAARLLSSFVATARFVVAQRGGQDPNGSIAKLTALHGQSTQQARIESKFSLAEKPAGFLDWDAVQRVRAAAETALRAAKTDAAKLKGVRDVTVLRLLADQPPDRVGVTRTLQLGSTLKRAMCVGV